MPRKASVVAVSLGVIASFSIGLLANDFCPTSLGWRADSDLQSAAIADLLAAQHSLYRLRRAPAGIALVPYENAEIFRQLNPQCCRVERLPFASGDGFSAPTFLQRVFGASSKLVIIDYDERERDEAGQTRSNRQKLMFHPTACGRPSHLRF